MKLTTKIIIITSLIFYGKNLLGQDRGPGKISEGLIGKEWKLVSFEEEGEKFSPSPDQIGDRMRFLFDQEVKYIEMSKMNVGTWKYDSTSNALLIINSQTKEEKTMKVLKLTNTDFILEYKDPDGIQLKMYMIAVAEW